MSRFSCTTWQNPAFGLIYCHRIRRPYRFWPEDSKCNGSRWTISKHSLDVSWSSLGTRRCFVTLYLRPKTTTLRIKISLSRVTFTDQRSWLLVGSSVRGDITHIQNLKIKQLVWFWLTRNGNGITRPCHGRSPWWSCFKCR